MGDSAAGALHADDDGAAVQRRRDVERVHDALLADPGAAGSNGNAPPRDSDADRTARRAPPAQLTPLQRCVTRQVGAPIGMHKTNATADGQVQSNVDELYRLELGLQNPRTWRDTDPTKGWESTSANGLTRLGVYGADGGKRSAFVRVPDRKSRRHRAHER